MQEAGSWRSLECGKLFSVHEDVPAIPFFRDASGRVHLLPLTKLGRGAHLHICGPGLNSNTLAVCSNGSSFYLFLDDAMKVLHAS